ncbi:unnamed protein product [Mycena citricolor]|uniref:DUF6534 domain-containing protein n=1 Tax=Mycena citricolor TaxID=2018698 RepID=A0AAD2GTM1_9AGAR|nr:unnamed protein product [Mycena citricolor]
MSNTTSVAAGLGPGLTYTPILFGGALALLLSGIVAVQCIIFFKLYPDESRWKTWMVRLVWIIDISHTTFILVALYDYFVRHFGDTSFTAWIPWSIAFTILFTTIQTCIVHLFYAAKIYRSSGKNLWITVPIITLALARQIAAVAATFEMFHYRRWQAFGDPDHLGPRLLFTIGLSLSGITDALITVCLCYYLRKIRILSSSSVMNGVLDTLTLYTLENGLITCLMTVGALCFWLFIPGSALSLSLHFVIGKLYPNSLLVLLNTRKELREMHAGDQGIHFEIAHDHHLAHYYAHFPHRAPASHKPQRSTSETPLPVHHAHATYLPKFKIHHPQPKPKAVTRSASRATRNRNSATLTAVSGDGAEPTSLRNASLNWRQLP